MSVSYFEIKPVHLSSYPDLQPSNLGQFAVICNCTQLMLIVIASFDEVVRHTLGVNSAMVRLYYGPEHVPTCIQDPGQFLMGVSDKGAGRKPKDTQRPDYYMGYGEERARLDKWHYG